MENENQNKTASGNGFASNKSAVGLIVVAFLFIFGIIGTVRQFNGTNEKKQQEVNMRMDSLRIEMQSLIDTILMRQAELKADTLYYDSSR